MKTLALLHLIIFALHFVKSSDEKLTNKQNFKKLKKSLKFIKETCGEICDQSLTGKPGEYFEHIIVWFFLTLLKIRSTKNFLKIPL